MLDQQLVGDDWPVASRVLRAKRVLRGFSRGTSLLRVAGFTAAVVLAFAGASFVLIRLAPSWLTETSGLSAAERDEALGRTRTAVLALGAGAIAVTGALYTVRTFALNRRGQLTERFGRAIEHLGSDATAVRLGGIYSLERIAHESRDEYGPIVEILTAYIRENSAWPHGNNREPPAASAEVKAIMTVLARRNTRYEADSAPPVDLSRTNLRGVAARGIDLTGARMRGAQLQGADLQHARLENVALQEAGLQAANFLGASLSGASLAKSNLARAVFTRADLGDVTLAGADLQGALFYAVDLTFVTLKGANLRGARASAKTTRWPPDFDPKAAGVQQRTSP